MCVMCKLNLVCGRLSRVVWWRALIGSVAVLDVKRVSWRGSMQFVCKKSMAHPEPATRMNHAIDDDFQSGQESQNVPTHFT
mmetsp:Transcript_23589/g.58281  ORF Transcript_23589/g.58281 Transcript_23589/m.58281 type:complete len:81 (-) Transcript_23589:23-265(-)